MKTYKPPNFARLWKRTLYPSGRLPFRGEHKPNNDPDYRGPYDRQKIENAHDLASCPEWRGSRLEVVTIEGRPYYELTHPSGAVAVVRADL